MWCRQRSRVAKRPIEEVEVLDEDDVETERQENELNPQSMLRASVIFMISWRRKVLSDRCAMGRHHDCTSSIGKHLVVHEACGR